MALDDDYEPEYSCCQRSVFAFYECYLGWGTTTDLCYEGMRNRVPVYLDSARIGPTGSYRIFGIEQSLD